MHDKFTLLRLCALGGRLGVAGRLQAATIDQLYVVAVDIVELDDLVTLKRFGLQKGAPCSSSSHMAGGSAQQSILTRRETIADNGNSRLCNKSGEGRLDGHNVQLRCETRSP